MEAMNRYSQESLSFHFSFEYQPLSPSMPMPFPVGRLSGLHCSVGFMEALLHKHELSHWTMVMELSLSPLPSEEEPECGAENANALFMFWLLCKPAPTLHNGCSQEMF